MTNRFSPNFFEPQFECLNEMDHCCTQQYAYLEPRGRELHESQEVECLDVQLQVRVVFAYGDVFDCVSSHHVEHGVQRILRTWH